MPRNERSNSRRRSTRRENAPKPLLHIAGYVAARPEVRTNRDGDEFTSFRVGINRFYDDEEEESTRWYGVAVNKPAVQDFVLENLRKGTAVVVEGTPSTHEYQGETQHDLTGYKVGLVDWFVAGSNDYDNDRDEDDEDL
jgi:single-stranded DNA-binding protein